MKLTVGQIVYAFFKKGSKLLPAQVVEEHIVKSISSDTEYKYMLLFDPTKDPVDASRLDAELFATTEAVTDILLERSMTTIQKMVVQAEYQAETLFPSKTDESSKQQPGPEQDLLDGGTVALDNDSTIVELPDGRMAKLVHQQGN